MLMLFRQGGSVRMVPNRKSLLEEFETLIAPQKAALSTRLPQLFQQYYAPPHDLLAIAGSQPPKRAHPSDQQPQDSKRLKAGSTQQADADKRLDALFRDIANMIGKKLWAKKESIPFREPVDIVKNKIPDYHHYVKQPMDLGTVKAKLASKREYKTPLEVCEEVRLVFRNCATYNQAGTMVRNYGDMLADVWEKSWQEARIEERWAEIMYMKDPTSCAVPVRVAHLSNQLNSAMSLIPAGSTQPTDTLSDLEKRKLSIQLAELQGEQLAGLLSLIQDDLPASGADDEIELDLDALPATTLLKMQSFVESFAASRPGMSAPIKQAATLDGRITGRAQLGSHAQRSSHDDTEVAASSGLTSPVISGDSQEGKGYARGEPKGGPFLWSSKADVNGSATAPHAASSILRDRTAACKPDMHVNAANWPVAALQPGATQQQPDDVEDEMWGNLEGKEEQNGQQAEEQCKLKKEQQEQEFHKATDTQAEEGRCAASGAQERDKAVQAEEARLQGEHQLTCGQQGNKEVDAIQASQVTANLVQTADGAQAQPQPHPAGDLAAVGLTYCNDGDGDVDFSRD